MLHSSVLIRNATRNIHQLYIDITRRFRGTIKFYHILGSADKNSKFPENLDPIEVVLSHLWQHGMDEMLLDLWPIPDTVFLEVKGGKLFWVPAKKQLVIIAWSLS